MNGGITISILVGIRKENTRAIRVRRCHECSGNGRKGITGSPLTPGLAHLIAPVDPSGTAILKPGQYRKSWRLGKHSGAYEAQVQRQLVTVIRDHNRDGILDFHYGCEQTGFFGINIHRAASQAESRYVNNWSVGCQVFAHASKYTEFIKLCKLAASEWGMDSPTHRCIHHPPKKATGS